MEESDNVDINVSEKNQRIESSTIQPRKIEQKNSIVALDLSEDPQAPTNQSFESRKNTQKKDTLSIPEDKKEDGEVTKRSDESEFVNWEITTVKSGKFFFSEKKKDSILDQDQEDLPQISITSEPSKPQEKSEKKKKQTKKEQERGNLKILKTLSSAKKELLKYFTQELSVVLKKMKPVKMLFAHFCKENNLTSMKSTLFDDKQKVMEQMSLNKWMVFCKEFEIIDRLCLKNVEEINKETSLEQLQRQQKKVKALKRAENTLINVFKAVNQNKSKIIFDDFVSGLVLIYEQFKSVYSYDQQGARKFLNEVLYCSSEKQCLIKLSGLKFTAGTPKITYDKKIVPPVDVNTLSRSKYHYHQKENNSQGSIKKGGKVKTSPFASREKLNINPVIREAKQTLQKNLKHKYSQHHQKSKAKLVLGSVNEPKDKSSSHHEMFQYFQETKDPILDSYFVMQRKKLTDKE